MALIRFVHILAAGFWLGCVAVEIVLERSRGGRDTAKNRRLSRRIDLSGYLGIPLAVAAVGLGFVT